MKDLLKGTNVYLVGMMGSGKTTVGRIVAKQLGYRFFDTDKVIEQVTGQSINEIFSQTGEAEFRQVETQVLAELSAYTRLTIATGGGTVLKRDNWSYLHHGIVVWLDVPVAQLYARLRHDQTRPLLRSPNPLATLEQLLSDRQSLYAQADLRVTLDQPESPTQVATRVLEAIPPLLKPHTTHV